MSPPDDHDKCCVICLGGLTEQCEIHPCQHTNFDFVCLITWLAEHPTCPLCKTSVSWVKYRLSKDGKEGNVYKLPERRDHSNGTTSARPRQTPNVSEAIQRRRFVYRHNLYSFHVGSNRRQSAHSRHIELSPERFMTDSSLVSRARTWLRRELKVFGFLHADPSPHSSGHRSRLNKAEFLREYIIAILKSIDTQGSAGQAQNMIQEFLGRKHTQLFLHELRAWLRSPCETLQEWDRIVQYGTPFRGSPSRETAAENATRSTEAVAHRLDGVTNSGTGLVPSRHHPYNERPLKRRNEQS